MKLIITKLRHILFVFALCNSSIMIVSMDSSDTESEDLLLYDDLAYSFFSQRDIRPEECDASYYDEELHDEATSQDAQMSSLYPYAQSVMYENPDTLIINETASINMILNDETEPEFNGSQSERKHVSQELIHEAHKELQKADKKLTKVQAELENLEQIPTTNNTNNLKRALKKDIIKKNIAIAATEFNTATKQIQRLAQSTDAIIQKEFETARNSLTRALHDTGNKLNDMTKSAHQQFKKAFKV